MILQNNPQLMDSFKSSIIEGMRKLVDTILELDFSINDEQREKIRLNHAEKFLSVLKSQYDNPVGFKKLLYSELKKQWMSYEELSGHMMEMSRDLRDKGGFGEEDIEKYKIAFDGILRYARMNDRIVERLVDISKKEGLEKAMEEEVRYEIIRDLFPTEDDYRTFYIQGAENLGKFFIELQEILAKADMDGGIESMTELSEFAEATKGFFKVTEDFQKVYLEKIVKEIYGGE